LVETQLKINNLKKIEEILLNFKPNELLKMRCTEPVIKKIPKIRVISKRTKGTYAETIPALIGDLMNQISSKENQEQFVKITGPIMYICHDIEYKEKDADIEVAVPISGRITIQSEDIEVKNLPEETVLSIVYTGPYDEIGMGYQKIFEHTIKDNYKLKGAARELYLNDPNETTPENYLTEIQQLIIENNNFR